MAEVDPKEGSTSPYTNEISATHTEERRVGIQTGDTCPYPKEGSQEQPQSAIPTSARTSERESTNCKKSKRKKPSYKVSFRTHKFTHPSKKKKRRGCRGGRKIKKSKVPVGKGIYNLSTAILTPEELQVLDRGLKFAPVRNLNKFQTYVNVQKFVRGLHLKRYFLSNPITKNSNPGIDYHSGLRNKSTFNPPGGDTKHIQVFKDLVIRDLESLKVPNIRDPPHIKKGICSLSKRKDIVIRPADKGGGLVILNKKDYQTEVARLLSDRETYSFLNKDPMLEFKNQLSGLVLKGKNLDILDKKEALYLDPLFCRTPVLYCLPKIHKSLDRPPGRPIVNGIDSITSRLGQYIDFYLQPLVTSTKAYLKDTKHVIQILEDVPCTENTLLITADVSSLYTIIGHKEALDAVEWALGLSKLSKSHQIFLLECLDFCLLKNYFWYDQAFYLQTRGVAMGAKFAPSVANLFMAHWEEESVFAHRPHELVCYFRYIDDLILVWEGSRTSLDSFTTSLDSNQKNIVLSWDVQTEQITFLDLDIQKEANKIITRNHFKKTDRNSYIPLNSCHHPHWLLGIPKGQFVRLRRNCTSIEDYNRQSMILEERFIEKGYDRSVVLDKAKEVGQIERSALLQNRQGVSGGNFQSRLILDYNVQYKKFERIVRKHWHVLKTDVVLSSVLPERPQFVYRKAPTLRDLIAPGVLDPPRIARNGIFSQMFTGFYGCGRCVGCKCAQTNLRKKQEFVATATNITYPIKDMITCDTKGVVYMLQCGCGLQYVGRTSRELRVRIREHIYNIKKGCKTHNVSRHFKLMHHCNPSSLKFWGIERVTPHWRGGNFIRQLSKRESYWIFQTQTLVPGGLNIDFDLNCFISDR